MRGFLRLFRVQTGQLPGDMGVSVWCGGGGFLR